MFGLSKYAINTYFAMLVVTVIASGATLIIVHVATAADFQAFAGSEGEYADLERSILGR